jgi:phospholipase A1
VKTPERRAKGPVFLAALAAILPGGPLAAPQADPGEPGQPALAAEEEPKKKEKPSFFTDLWHLDEEARAGRPSVTFHRTNYVLVFSYNFSPNQAPWQALDPPKTLVKPEVAFQLSFKAKIWQDVFGAAMDLWIAYTQRSFWQLYDFEDSSPFRETDYEPEALLNFRTRFDLLGLKVRFIQVGINHQSNGQSEPLSRSWNRLVANAGLERGDFSLLVKGWYRLPEDPAEDDNPRMYDYLGYGEIWGYYFLGRHRLAVMLRDNLDFYENRGAIQIEWSFPLFAQVGGYLQYFAGHGESLLDYDHHVNRIGIGFVLVEWN